MIAGSDTTATTMSAILSYLSAYPSIRSRLLSEIDAATVSGLISPPVPTYDEVATNLPYYTSVVKETLRLSPSAPAIPARSVSLGGLTIAGRHVPEGMEVACNPWIVNRDKGVWGEDAEEFKPER